MDAMPWFLCLMTLYIEWIGKHATGYKHDVRGPRLRSWTCRQRIAYMCNFAKCRCNLMVSVELKVYICSFKYLERKGAQTAWRFKKNILNSDSRFCTRVNLKLWIVNYYLDIYIVYIYKPGNSSLGSPLILSVASSRRNL